jgi:hypothetical protein
MYSAKVQALSELCGYANWICGNGREARNDAHDGPEVEHYSMCRQLYMYL